MTDGITREVFEQHQREVDRRFEETHKRIGGVKRSADEDIAAVQETAASHAVMIGELRDSSKTIEGLLTGIKSTMVFIAGLLAAGAAIATIWAVFR